MIYHSKTADNKKQTADSRQAGVTLLLAILLLSFILAISFSLASILFIEIRTSGDLTRSEAALYASTGVSEQALFNLKRQVSCGNNCYVAQFNNNVSLNGVPVTSTTSTPIFQAKVFPGSSFSQQPDIYNFCVGSSGSGCGYSKITVTYLSTGNTDPLTAWLCQFNPAYPVATSSPGGNYYSTPPCSSTDQNQGYSSSYWQLDPGLVGVQITQTNNNPYSWNLDPAQQQELILYTQSANPIYVSIEAFGSALGTPEGLPLQGKTSVTVDVINGDVGRKVQVLVPQ